MISETNTERATGETQTVGKIICNLYWAFGWDQKNNH
jgi:hypothetical protein